MSSYSERLTCAQRAHQDASNSFRGAKAAEKIRGATLALAGPMDRLAGQISRRREGLYDHAEQFKADAGSSLRQIGTGLQELTATILAAQRTDRAKAAATIVDQGRAAQKFIKQRAADQSLIEECDAILESARSDAEAAAELPSPADTQIDPSDVDALKRSIAERASPREDAIAIAQIRQIGGQAYEDI